jgi:gliding motility-associated-like protein
VARGYQLFLENGFAKFGGSNGSSSFVKTLGANIRVNDGNWHHIVGTVHDGEWACWVDCTINGTAVQYSSNPNLKTLEPLNIGYYQFGNQNHFKGKIDELRMYNRVLDTAEIMTLCDINFSFATPPTLSKDTIVCLNDTIEFNAYSPNGMVYWESPLGTIIDSGTTHTEIITNSKVLYAYTFYNGIYSDTSILNVTATPCVGAYQNPVISDTTICEDSTGYFVINHDSGDVIWQNPLGTTTHLGDSMKFDNLTTSTFFVFIQYNSGYSDTIKFVMTVEKCTVGTIAPLTDITFPNVFTPNGDGVNDYLVFTIPFATCFDLVIYNRWGVEIHKSNQVEFGWDGRIQSSGIPVEDGVYFYSLTYCVNGGTAQVKNGTVTIFNR